MTTSKKALSISGNFLRINLHRGMLGILVGIIIIGFSSLLQNKLESAQTALLTLLFSFFITLSITSTIALFQSLFKSLTANFWAYIAGYYACNITGMIIGTELSYFIVSSIFKVPYHIANHLNDYKFNLLVVVIVGTLMLLHKAQKATMLSLLNEKEVDLVKEKQLTTQAELRALQSKINPHFLYNSLNSIASLVHENADKAEDMTLKLSKLFRYSINASQDNLTTVMEEIDILNTYLDIEKVRFGDRIQFIIQIDEASKDQLIPRFLIQPLVENALKHGLQNMGNGGILKVTVNKKEDQTELYIYDNGTPFPDELIFGYGLQSTYEKLQLLYKDAFDLQIINTPQKFIRILIPSANEYNLEVDNNR